VILFNAPRLSKLIDHTRSIGFDGTVVTSTPVTIYFYTTGSEAPTGIAADDPLALTDYVELEPDDGDPATAPTYRVREQFLDPETGRIVTSTDKAWNFRLFRITPQKPLWHAIFSDTNRFSLGYRVSAKPSLLKRVTKRLAGLTSGAQLTVARR